MPITPHYLRIAADIRSRIASGALKPGDKLPSTAELREQYGVSNTAIRNAMIMLRAENLIEGHQGSASMSKHPTLISGRRGRGGTPRLGRWLMSGVFASESAIRSGDGRQDARP